MRDTSLDALSLCLELFDIPVGPHTTAPEESRLGTRQPHKEVASKLDY